MSRSGRRRFLGAIPVLFLAPAGVVARVPRDARAATPAMPLDVLFAAFARSPGLFARFREDKHIALLVSPLRSEGTVHFERARGLARHTLAPTRRSILLSDGTLTIWDGTKTDSIALSSQPGLRAFAEAFTMFLAADRAGLERAFAMELSGDPRASWRLRLAPLSPQLKKIVSEMEVTGQAVALTTLRVTEASGDVGTTTFSEVDAAKQYTPAEAAAVFRVPSAAPKP